MIERNDVVIARGILALTAVGAVALAVAGQQRDAQAFPAYSKKEGKPCSYCHVNPAGGGKRSAAGIYYKQHNLSLVGFTPGAASAPAPAAKPTPKPVKAAVKTKTAKPTPKAKMAPTKKK